MVMLSGHRWRCLSDYHGRAKEAEISQVTLILVTITRPETIPGDVAVAVHPEDSKYGCLIGKRLRIPLSGFERTIPIIADDYVDPNFGTGALKITPGTLKQFHFKNQIDF